VDIDDVKVGCVHGIAERRIQDLTEHRAHQNEYKREKGKHADDKGPDSDAAAKDQPYDRCPKSENGANNPAREDEQGKSL